ncbi:Fic family protein [Candidatus Gottesmanbacteria bacterium]|nr:Fic family protein [Candidatus Gottesmanbacteria bacterium]
MYKPKFTITPEINSQIAEIERIRIIIERSRILPTREVVLRQRAAIEATRSSTGIEGNPLNEKQVAMVLSGQKINASERFVAEVVNYKKALNFIEKRGKDRSSITANDMLAMHRIVMKNLLPPAKVGQFRKTPIYIVDIKNGKEMMQYQGPESSRISGLISGLFEWLSQGIGGLHPLLAAGLLHFEFVSIHPFSDGNGRVTRLLTLLYLRQRGYDFRGVLVPDTYYYSDRPRYYAALNQGKDYESRRKADATPWLSYFIEGFLAVAQDLQDKIVVAGFSESKTSVVTLTPEDYQLLHAVANFGRIGINEIILATHITKRTAQRRLKYLTGHGFLARIGKGPSTQYVLKKSP